MFGMIAAFLLGLVASWKFWVGAGTIIVVLVLLLRRGNAGSISLGLPFNLGSMTIDISQADRVLAWKLYIQLVTRKAALLFDDEYDLVADVYDSLFALFKETRVLLLELPPNEFRKKQGISVLALRILNDGLRPHLTRWQAEFREWWKKQLPLDRNDETLQTAQSRYPRFNELVLQRFSAL